MGPLSSQVSMSDAASQRGIHQCCESASLLGNAALAAVDKRENTAVVINNQGDAAKVFDLNSRPAGRHQAAREIIARG